MTEHTPHTPGPWWRDDDGFVAAGSGDTYQTIADFDCSPDLSIDEREANKALAIAAPDLLDACEAVVAAWERGDLAMAARMCSAAIAKARG